MQAAGPDPWPGGGECGGGDTMNALAANDFEAADLLALARLDDAPGRPVPDMKARREPLVPRGSGRVSGQQWQAGGGMSRGAVVAAEMTDGTGSARARTRVLAAQPVE